MKSSNLFSDYMVASSVNRSIRSINNSPTSGVIHKQRSSYGPRLTLVNKSRDESMSKSRQNFHQQQQQNQKHIQKIFLLMLQTNRLQQLHEQSIKQSSQSLRQSKLQIDRQITHYKQTNQTLKIAIKTLQGSLMKCEEEKMKVKMEYQQRVSGLELEVKTMSLRLGETQKQVGRLKRDKQQLMLEIQKQSIQHVAKSESISQSRAFFLQQQLQRSKQHQLLTFEISSLRQQVTRYKLTLQQQQSIIRTLKQQHESLQQREMQLMMANHQYAQQFEQIKKRTNYQLVNKQVNTQIQQKDMVRKDSIQKQYVQLRQQVTGLQYELSQLHKEYTTKQRKQSDGLMNEIKEKQLQVNNLSKELRQNKLVIAQYKLNNDMLRQNMQKLNTHANERQFWSNKKIQSIQQELKQQVKNKQIQVKQLKERNKQLLEQNIIMKEYIEQQQKSMNMRQLEYSVQNIDLENKLKRTQRRLNSAKKGMMLQGISHNNNNSNSNKNGDNIYYNNHSTTALPQTKLFKSRSIESTSFFSYNNNITNTNNTNTNNMRKSLIDLNLQNIVSATVNLQGSNQRSLRLINRSQQKLITSCMSPIKSKRKVFVQINNASNNNNTDKGNNKSSNDEKYNQQDSEISFQECRTKYNRNKLSSSATKNNNSRYYVNSKNNNNNNNDDNNMRSSIHQYYGLEGGNQ